LTQQETSQEEFEDMLTALDESTMVTITDGEGTFLYVNKLFCDVSKFPKEDKSLMKS